MTKAMRESFIKNFSEDGDQAPTDEQLKNMIDSWVASEILYREGKALGVDKGDETIRDRIAFKLQVLVFDQVQLEKPSEEQLRAYFEKNRSRYDQPEQVSFLLTPATDEATVHRQFDDMRAEREDPDLRDRTRAFPNRPVNTLAASFGENFSTTLLGLPIGEWRIVQASDGWRIARLDARKAAQPASFESLRDELRLNWKTDETRKRAWDAVTKLKAGYTVKIEQ
ncbi:peptidyl-prolyl cis-trans isomerase [Bradyrhizobium sp. INPA01-394B]|uniref:peptidylprolyl isomerase n=1 Tax=Bradyrhizobium campsiandrae TaxID=1729892 RepID=A0ABR7U9N9_9BRAD|nr:peptidyl-prolyl cis-trans isomerase [Bradyrhizobium campsiandrae]MBC9980784.1 peptidyl-prolyl cis-trans isomerase [Bradyrhizobium campsiandrae]